MKLSKTQVFQLVILLFYIVGFAGLSNVATQNLFEKLVPFHLLLMFALILVSHAHKNSDFWKFIVTTYFAGFVIELLGVHSGAIFGEYSYGNTLGYKVADIPLIIGINWILMIYSVGAFLCDFNISSRFFRAIIGAALLTITDILIEPVAVKYDYWNWENLDIPLQNSVAWFLFSFFMLLVFFNLRFKKQNPVGAVLFVIQVLFFLALNISLGL